MDRIYADHNATSPVDLKHYDEVTAILKKVDGNPSSIHHQGREAKIALEDARESIAKLINVNKQEIIFTSGATESNNMAMQGVVNKHARDHVKPHIIITATEHASVKTPAEILQERGLCTVSVISVDSAGVVNQKKLLAEIKENTVLVSMIFANNEVGSVNPVREISDKIKEKNSDAHVHVDGVQALGKVDLSWLASSNIDSFSASNHKVCGYKGIGFLYLKKKTPLNVLICGGGQERGRRSGTENLPGIISFGLRAKDLMKNPGWLDHVPEIRAKLVKELTAIKGVVFHGDLEKGLPTTLNFHVDGIAGEDVMLNFDLAGISVSSGSACSSGVRRPSSVLMAMGYNEWEALNSTRISFGCSSRIEDVDKIVSTLKQVIKRSSY